MNRVGSYLCHLVAKIGIVLLSKYSFPSSLAGVFPVLHSKDTHLRWPGHPRVRSTPNSFQCKQASSFYDKQISWCESTLVTEFSYHYINSTFIWFLQPYYWCLKCPHYEPFILRHLHLKVTLTQSLRCPGQSSWWRIWCEDRVTGADRRLND